jgi:DNA-binding NarL/FixJ family response regulator
MSEALGATPGHEDGAEKGSVRVLIVDDHGLFRTGLRTLLEEQGIHVVGEAGDGAEAIGLVRELAPEVVLMDLNMPGIDGVEATQRIARDAPLTRVVVLTISDDDTDVMDAILAGACGYLLKDASIHELVRGINAAAGPRAPCHGRPRPSAPSSRIGSWTCCA